MKKLLFFVLIFSLGFLQAQIKKKTTSKSKVEKEYVNPVKLTKEERNRPYMADVLKSHDVLTPEEAERRRKNISVGNPFAKYGYYPKIATLSRGKYLEFHDRDSIVVIGSIKYNTKQKKVVEFLEKDLSDPDAQPIGDTHGRWMSPDPLSEEFPDWSPYRYGFNNPIKFTDPTGMLEDDYIFNEQGDYVRTDKNNLPDKLVVEDSKTKERTNYSFADPIEDPKQIDAGIINKLIFVSEKQITDMLKGQGTFDTGKLNFAWESQGGGKFDYSYSVLPKKFADASDDPLKSPSNALFLPAGDKTVHNQMNFGNYLWGASGFTAGLGYGELQTGAQMNSKFNSRRNGYVSQWDSKDDQKSIVLGAYHAYKNNYRPK